MYFPHLLEIGLTPCDRKHFQKNDFHQQLPQGLPQLQGNIHLHISLLRPVLHAFGDWASCKCLAISTQPRTTLRAMPASELPAKLAKNLLHLNFISTYSSAQSPPFTTVKHGSHDTSFQLEFFLFLQTFFNTALFLFWGLSWCECSTLYHCSIGPWGSIPLKKYFSSLFFWLHNCYWPIFNFTDSFFLSSYFLFSYLLFYGPIYPVSQKPKGTGINAEVRANWSWSSKLPYLYPAHGSWCSRMRHHSEWASLHDTYFSYSHGVRIPWALNSWLKGYKLWRLNERIK